MQNRPPAPPQGKSRPPRMRLPFEKRKTDLATWVYYHRAGILATVIAVMVFGIALVSGKVYFGREEGTGMILVDFNDEQRQEQERQQRIEQLERVESYDYSAALNRISNENSEFDASLRDAEGTNASQIYDEAGKLGDQMNANRAAYEEGLRRVEQMRNTPDNRSSSEAGGRQDAKVNGKVTVSFSFSDPVRTSAKLVVPAYLCEGGGEVVVNVTLNNNGDVTSAAVDRARSTNDECMRTTAEKAARGSRFNLDRTAPAKHTGTITYVFVPQ